MNQAAATYTQYERCQARDQLRSSASPSPATSSRRIPWSGAGAPPTRFSAGRPRSCSASPSTARRCSRRERAGRSPTTSTSRAPRERGATETWTRHPCAPPLQSHRLLRKCWPSVREGSREGQESPRGSDPPQPRKIVGHLRLAGESEHVSPAATDLTLEGDDVLRGGGGRQRLSRRWREAHQASLLSPRSRPTPLRIGWPVCWP